MATPELSKLLERRLGGNIDSVEFMETFRKYDIDGNNYIEANELDKFIKDLFYRVYKMEPYVEPQQTGLLQRFKGLLGSGEKKEKENELEQFKETYFKDFLKDNRIDLRELAEILPIDECLDVKFRCKDMTSVDFMKVWNKYDTDGEGFLSEEQLRGFTADYFGGVKNITPENIDKQVQNILAKSDRDKDGVINLEEMAKYLGVEDNFLRKFKIKKGQKISDSDFDKIWKHYDKDHSGSIKGAELDALIRDIFTKLHERPPEMEEFVRWKDIILDFSDADGDGAIKMGEMKIFFAQGVNEALKRLK